MADFKRKRVQGDRPFSNGASKKQKTSDIISSTHSKAISPLDAARRKHIEKKAKSAEQQDDEADEIKERRPAAKRANGVVRSTEAVPRSGESDNEESRQSEEEQDAPDMLPGEDEPLLNAQDDNTQTKTFQELGVIDPLCEACEKMGFVRPTPIQAGAIPAALAGRDVIGLAETGSGKTAAFAIPILQALMEKTQPYFALVLAPTRELAVQIKDQFEALGSVIGVRVAPIVGGMNMVDQQIQLAKNPHIIVATPGRLIDHLQNTKGFSLRKTKYLVMDEADRMLDDADFMREVDKVLQAIPRETRRTYLFSATISSKVEGLQRASLKDPVMISMNDQQTGAAKLKTVKNLVQSFMFIPLKLKNEWLVALLSSPAHRNQTAIIFARTHQDVTKLTYMLRALGIQAIPLHGGLSQSQRLSSLNRFKQHMSNILVATDVAARGLDIPSVDLILNYDLPDTDATYVHRVGRTARAGKSGKAISFVTQLDIEIWLRIEHALGKKIDKDTTLSKDDVLVFGETVDEAMAQAKKQIMEETRKKTEGRNRKRGKPGGMGKRDDRDRDEG
jgi:ATP-dependent RNA helicase DDX47/RRP3